MSARVISIKLSITLLLGLLYLDTQATIAFFSLGHIVGCDLEVDFYIQSVEVLFFTGP
jgi:hypothetical protein